MSLGVLNNLSAVYAENNLNNTNNSLSKTLQQLSSGSRINSGADDAAGLSLVDGLQANQTALTQSGTNAQEGVGLLQVADGALSQVTSLLNRAVTLATEVSNGTLNGSQETAANQEYQSILSEVNNIGSTTTYNQQTVFGGSDVGIYTGDSSSASASVDSLHFATVSSSSVGDAGGTMNYSAGQGVFIDLQTGAAGAAVNGSTIVNPTSGTAVMTVKNWNPSGAGQVVTNTISTDAANETVNQLINQINSSGLGVTASLETAGQATGASGATTLDEGI
ncbi:MAG: flagellin, partial [Terracidiphilus sp.]